MSESSDQRIDSGNEHGDDDKGSSSPVGQKRPSPSSRRPKIQTRLGEIPLDLNEVNMNTTDHESDTARSLAVMPGIHQFGQLPLDAGSRPAHAGARLVPPPLSSLAQADPTSLASTTISAAAAGHWDLADRDVKTLPDFHPIERTAVFVPNCKDAASVAGRVSDVLRARSISAEYENSKAKAKCMTNDNVDFRIRLYRGKKNFNHGVICEVQRRYGFSTTFSADVAAILDAAEGKSMTQSSVPVTSPSNLVSDDDDTPNDETGLESVKIASEMITGAESTIDRKLMGLQGLASLTDPCKIGKSTAARASAEILAGSTDEASAARDYVLSLVLISQDADLGADEATSAILRTLALVVLSNVLTNMAGRPELKALKPVLSQAILPALLQDLGAATSSPRRADLATRSLLPVVRTFDADFIESDLTVRGAYELLVAAQSIGETRYDSLRANCTDCLTLLDCATR